LADDRGVFFYLVRDADVVIDNYLPARLKGFGIRPADLVARHKQLIWCTISGFGEDSSRPGYDFVIQAEAGWMAITGEPGGSPMKSGVALADVIAGKDAAIAILARVIERSERDLTASRRRLHISLIDSATAALTNVAQNVLVRGRDAERWGNAHANLVPYQLFDAMDRPIVVAVGSDAQWAACATALSLDDLGADPRLKSNPGRISDRARIVSAIAKRIAERPAAEWIETLERAGVPCGTVKTVSEALASVSAALDCEVPSPLGGKPRLDPPLLDADGEAIRTLGWRAFDTR